MCVFPPPLSARMCNTAMLKAAGLRVSRALNHSMAVAAIVAKRIASGPKGRDHRYIGGGGCTRTARSTKVFALETVPGCRVPSGLVGRWDLGAWWTLAAAGQVEVETGGVGTGCQARVGCKYVCVLKPMKHPERSIADL